jgi:hypothetical protein
MFKLVVLACAVAAVSGAADPILAYANGLHYGGAYANLAYAPAAAYGYAAPAAAYGYAAPAAAYGYAPAAAYAAGAAYAAAPVAYAAHAPAAYALPPTQVVNEAPIVEQVVEPVEQWGYKVAY